MSDFGKWVLENCTCNERGQLFIDYPSVMMVGERCGMTSLMINLRLFELGLLFSNLPKWNNG